MVHDVLLYCLITLSLSIPLAVGCAIGLSKRGSRSTPTAKRPTSPPEMPDSPSRSEIASLRADVDSLCSTLEKNSTTLKRLSSRQGMRELRERKESGSVPPRGAGKAELLRHYGFSGKVGPAFAQAQLQMERAQPESDEELN